MNYLERLCESITKTDESRDVINTYCEYPEYPAPTAHSSKQEIKKS